MSAKGYVAKSLSIAALLIAAVPLPAQTQALLLPSAVAYDTEGNLYFVDTNLNQAFVVSLAGTLTTIAGTGTQGFAGDGAAATAAELNAPQGIAVGADNTIYIADTANHRIRVIANGIITTFAGTGIAGFSGDNAAAIAATLRNPTALALDASGALLLCDTGNNRVRKVAAGTITTIAGDGTQGFSGDGAAATAAELDSPTGIAVTTDGRIILADSHNHRLRSVSPQGIITTIAGTGTAGFSGDNGLATAAQLFLPRGISVDTAGNILFADSNNQRLRSINPQGIINTIAGNGTQGTSSDAAPVATAPLNNPRGVAVSSFNTPTLADAPNHFVRELAANGQLYTLAAPLARTTTVALQASPGQGTATITVSGNVATPQGKVTVLDSNTPIASAMLTNGSATISFAALAAGTHTLTVQYAGDVLNPAATSAATTLQVSKSPTTTTLQPTSSGYVGLPLLLTANITPAAATGTVTFLNGSAPVATTPVQNATASTFLTPSVGTLALTASYSGDTNFQPSTSSPVTATVLAMPDFMLTSTAATQTVVGGQIASFPLLATPQGGPFTGNITFSVAGLPKGATATFAPPSVVPGATGANLTLNVQTVPTLALNGRYIVAGSATLIWIVVARRRRRLSSLASWAILSLLLCGAGCGTRSVSSEAGISHSYSLTVTGTSTNLAGAIVFHTTVVQLAVQ